MWDWIPWRELARPPGDFLCISGFDEDGTYRFCQTAIGASGGAELANLLGLVLFMVALSFVARDLYVRVHALRWSAGVPRIPDDRPVGVPALSGQGTDSPSTGAFPGDAVPVGDPRTNDRGAG